MLRPVALAIVALLASLLEGDARGERELVKAGLLAYQELDYTRAADLLQRALAEDLGREERIATLRALGSCHVAVGQADQARAHFKDLLRLDPAQTLDRKISPRIRAVFDQAKTEVEKERAAAPPPTPPAPVGKPPAPQETPVAGGIPPANPIPGGLPVPPPPAPPGGGSPADPIRGGLPRLRPAALTPEAPQSAQEGEPVSVAGQASGAQLVELYHRKRGEAAYSKVVGAADASGSYEVTVPGLAVRGPGVDYYVLALGPDGKPVGEAGSAGRPLSVKVAETKRRRLYERPWLWGVVGGALVVGAAAGTTVGVVLNNSPATLTIMPFQPGWP